MEFDEGRLQNDFRVLSVEDNPLDSVVNDFEVLYGPNPVNTPPDPTLLRRANTASFTGVEYLNDSEDSFSLSDTRRQAAAAESVTLYGRRPFREAFDFYNTAAPVETMIKHRFDRYHKLQKRAVIRVLRKDYYTYDLFDTVKMSHSKLAGTSGIGDGLLVANDGAELIPDHNEVPLQVDLEGLYEGHVIEISEAGPFMFLTVETVSPF